MLIIYDNYHLLDLLKGPGKNKKNFSGGVLVGKNTPKVPKVPSTNQF